MVDNAKIIGERLRDLREALELSQADLCREIKCQTNRWNQYELGHRRITLEVADRLCQRYRVTLDWIYKGDPSQIPQRFLDLPTRAA